MEVTFHDRHAVEERPRGRLRKHGVAEGLQALGTLSNAGQGEVRPEGAVGRPESRFSKAVG